MMLLSPERSGPSTQQDIARLLELAGAPQPDESGATASDHETVDALQQAVVPPSPPPQPASLAEASPKRSSSPDGNPTEQPASFQPHLLCAAVSASVLAALLLSSSLLLLPTREAWRYIPAEHSERGKKHGTVAPSTC